MNPLTLALLNLVLRIKLGRARPPRQPPSGSPVTLPPDRLKIAAVQWNAEPVAAVEDWTQRIERLFEEASRSHCHLLVFPEYLPLSLLGAIMPDGVSAGTLTDAAVQSWLRSLGPVTYRFWHRWMAALSRKYQMVTVAGSGLMIQNGRLLNAAVIFDKDGRERVCQPKWHILPDEARWGISPGDAGPAEPMQPWGLTAVVCNDATYYESFRMAAQAGARVVAVPIADPEARYTEGKGRRGCFSRVQDVPMVGIVAASTGRLFGMRLTGKAGIYLPAEMTPDGSGVLAESELPAGEGLVSAVVSLSQLDEYRKRHDARFPVPPPEFLEALYQFEEDR